MHKLLEDLNSALDQKDVSKAKQVLSEMEQTVLSDNVLISEVTTPSVYSALQSRIVEDLGSNPRSMMLKNRVAARPRRAFLFIKALQNGVKFVE